MSFISYWTREIRPGHGFILGLNVYTTYIYIYRQVPSELRYMNETVLQNVHVCILDQEGHSPSNVLINCDIFIQPLRFKILQELCE